MIMDTAVGDGRRCSATSEATVGQNEAVTSVPVTPTVKHSSKRRGSDVCVSNDNEKPYKKPKHSGTKEKKGGTCSTLKLQGGFTEMDFSKQKEPEIAVVSGKIDDDAIGNWEPLMNALKVWRLKAEMPLVQEKISKYHGSIMFQFLQGNPVNFDSDNEKLITFLETKPQDDFGMFLPSLIVVEYVLKTDIGIILDLSPKIAECQDSPLSPFMALLKELIPCRILHEHSQKVISQENVAKIDQLGFEAIHESTTAEISQQNGFSSVNINALLVTMLRNDTSYTFRDSSCETLNRFMDLSFLSLSIIHEFDQEERSHPYHLLLFLQRHQQPPTSPGLAEYLKLNVDGHVQPLMMHTCMVDRFFKSTPKKDNCQPLIVTKEEIDTFINLVYCAYDTEKFKGKITFGLYKLAEQLTPNDLWEFLFRGANIQELSTTRNRKDMMEILVRQNRIREMNAYLRTLRTTVPGHKFYKILDKFSAESIIYFFLHSEVDMPEIDVYTFLVYWSYGQVQGNAPREDAKTEAIKKFNLVSKVLHLVDLQQSYDDLLLDGFIPAQEIVRFKILLQNKVPLESEFRLASRKKTLEPKEISQSTNDKSS